MISHDESHDLQFYVFLQIDIWWTYMYRKNTHTHLWELKKPNKLFTGVSKPHPHSWLDRTDAVTNMYRHTDCDTQNLPGNPVQGSSDWHVQAQPESIQYPAQRLVDHSHTTSLAIRQGQNRAPHSSPPKKGKDITFYNRTWPLQQLRTHWLLNSYYSIPALCQPCSLLTNAFVLFVQQNSLCQAATFHESRQCHTLYKFCTVCSCFSSHTVPTSYSNLIIIMLPCQLIIRFQSYDQTSHTKFKCAYRFFNSRWAYTWILVHTNLSIYFSTTTKQIFSFRFLRDKIYYTEIQDS